MDLKLSVHSSLDNAKGFVLDGCEQILQKRLDEKHGVSPSPGATALASLALLALGRGFERAQQRGVNWLWQQRQGNGWGKFPGDHPDDEITKLVTTVLQGSQGGWLAKIRLLAQARHFSSMILSLGERVVPGLEGPTLEEIKLPRILGDSVLAKLPIYGRPVVIAAALLASERHEGILPAVNYLWNTQMDDGSWSEDIVATSMGILALIRHRVNTSRLQKAGDWLVNRQYASGGWPAFDQLHTWAVGWAVCILAETGTRPEEDKWLKRAVDWLKNGQNPDGSWGSTPPFAHPDLDDTAVALIGLHQADKRENSLGVELLTRLQNEDGSWGTFPSFTGIPPHISCAHPVYIQSTDVTIHVLEALWRCSRSKEKVIHKGLSWLLSQQTENGEFPANWFDGEIYSTAQALELLNKWRFSWEQWKSARQILQARKKAFEYLLASQNSHGGWGRSVVETGLALSALLKYPKRVPDRILDKGIEYLLARQRPDGSFEPAYGGIYAKGWNYEEPLTTALTVIRALERYKLFH